MKARYGWLAWFGAWFSPLPVKPCVYCGKDTYPRRRVVVAVDHPHIPGGMAAHVNCGPRGRMRTVVSLIRYYRFR